MLVFSVVMNLKMMLGVNCMNSCCLFVRGMMVLEWVKLLVLICVVSVCYVFLLCMCSVIWLMWGDMWLVLVGIV